MYPLLCYGHHVFNCLCCVSCMILWYISPSLLWFNVEILWLLVVSSLHTSSAWRHFLFISAFSYINWRSCDPILRFITSYQRRPGTTKVCVPLLRYMLVLALKKRLMHSSKLKQRDKYNMFGLGSDFLSPQTFPAPEFSYWPEASSFWAAFWLNLFATSWRSRKQVKPKMQP